MKKSVPVFALIWIFCCLINSAHTAIAFTVSYFLGGIYYFDPDNPSVPATEIFPGISANTITSSPDGNTMYFTDELTSEVYSFPTYGPYTLTLLNSGQIAPIGIAVSNDGNTLFIATDIGVAGIYTLPATGGSVTQLTPTGIPIPTPLFLAVNGDTLYIGDFQDAAIYSTPISSSSTTYDATLLQSAFTTDGVGGIALSIDGYLYWSTANHGSTDWVFRVPIADPTSPPTLVGTGNSTSANDGLAVSCDGTTVFLTSLIFNPGVYSIPTNQGLPQPATLLTSLMIPEAIDITVTGCNALLTGFQKKCDFGLVYELSNVLSWSLPGATNGVSFYRIYRNGSQIATVNVGTSTYQDHDIEKGVTTNYSVTSVTQNGVESSPINITIP